MSISQLIIAKCPKMFVFDMAGTIINENGIVYKTLYDSIKIYNPWREIYNDERKKWPGLAKKDVLKRHVKSSDVEEVYGEFQSLLKFRYNQSPIKLVDNGIYDLFIKMSLIDSFYGNGSNLRNFIVHEKNDKLREDVTTEIANYNREEDVSDPHRELLNSLYLHTIMKSNTFSQNTLSKLKGFYMRMQEEAIEGSQGMLDLVSNPKSFESRLSSIQEQSKRSIDLAKDINKILYPEHKVYEPY